MCSMTCNTDDMDSVMVVGWNQTSPLVSGTIGYCQTDVDVLWGFIVLYCLHNLCLIANKSLFNNKQITNKSPSGCPSHYGGQQKYKTKLLPVWRTKTLFALDKVRWNNHCKHLGVAHNVPRGSKWLQMLPTSVATSTQSDQHFSPPEPSSVHARCWSDSM